LNFSLFNGEKLTVRYSLLLDV